MKRCPTCGRTFTNNTLVDCLNDGTPLVEDAPDTVSYYGAPMPASPETLSPAYPEDDLLDEEDPEAGFEEAPTTSAYPEPRFGQTPPYAAQPSYAAPPMTQETPSPYFAAAQTKKPRVPWGTLFVVAFAGAGIARLALHHSPQNATPSAESAPAATPSTAADTTPDLFPGFKFDNTLTGTPNGTLRSALISAVKGADAAEAKSFRTLNPAPLHSFYAGPALATELSEMEALRQAGTTQEGQLVAQRFKAAEVNPAQTKAQIDVAEEWKTIIRSKATGKPQKTSTESNSQTVTLSRSPHGWRVENIQFYEDPEQTK